MTGTPLKAMHRHLEPCHDELAYTHAETFRNGLNIRESIRIVLNSSQLRFNVFDTMLDGRSRDFCIFSALFAFLDLFCTRGASDKVFANSCIPPPEVKNAPRNEKSEL